VRAATPDDLPDLLVMWREHLDLGPRGDRSLPRPSEEGVLARLHEAQDNPDLKIMVANVGDQVAGMAVFTHQPVLALFDADAVHVHYLHVRPGHRRRGIGHALVAAAASLAEDLGAEHVVSNVAAHHREANRFYARLGFGALILGRSAAVPTLRRKLAASCPTVREEILARRRSLRLRSRTAARRVTANLAVHPVERGDASP
jgi:ribosomal protein S18 acetylase RimI-like enzyme